MLKDSYVEQSLRAKPEKVYYLKLFLAVWVVCIGLLMFLMGLMLGTLITAIGIVLFGYGIGEGRMEYEYILTNDNVEIAAIYNASRRREKMHFSLQQATMIVPKGSERISHENFKKTYDFTSKVGRGNEIAVVLELNDRKIQVLLEPDEKSLEHIKLYTKNKYYDI